MSFNNGSLRVQVPTTVGVIESTLDQLVSNGDVDLADLHVLVPGDYGLTVCPLDQLLTRDEDTEEDLITNSGIDSSGTNSPEEIAHLTERVRKLNETGDATAFWAPEAQWRP